MNAPLVTVFVPTYNRAHLLHRVLESLNAQTFKDFEWLIVDDGSSDHTSALVRSWQASSTFPIVYERKHNGGKHTAIHLGVQLARGKFMVILDSDDWLSPNALERMIEHWNALPNPAQYSGVAGLCAYADGTVIGDQFPQEAFDSNAVDLMHTHRVRGDKISLTRTSVMREFPFPFQHLRGLVSEALVWNRIAQRYQERCINEIFAYKEYLEDGLTDRSLELQIKAAPAARQYHLELTQVRQRIPLRARWKAMTNYVRFSLHAGYWPFEIIKASGSVLECLMVLPLGGWLYWRDSQRLADDAELVLVMKPVANSSD